MFPEYGHRVVCAAIKLTDGTMLVGVRHCDIYMREQMDRSGNDRFHGEQGFIDNKYQFLTRREAYVIAKAAGQLVFKGPGPDGMLFSEDLY